MEEEQYSIPSISTTDILSLHPQHQYYSSLTINNTTADNQMSDINYNGVMSNRYYHQEYPPRVMQGHQYSSTPTLDVDVDYEVRNDHQENNHVENKQEEEEEEEEIVPWQAATDDVSSWEWRRFGGTLESIVDQAPYLVPLNIQHVPDHGVYVHHGNEVEMENTVAQSKHSICNTEWMTVEEEDEHNQCYLTSHNSTSSPPPPSYHSQREARKKTEKRQMQRGKLSTTIPSSSTNKRCKATIQSILHNKSERKRRSKINDRLETLQKLVPNTYKTDKASILDQVIEYVKKLQTQKDQMMNMRLGMLDNNNMPVAVQPMMMMPHYITTTQAMQQHQQQYNQQMSMMTQMGMGMSMNPAGLVMMPTGSIVHPNMRHE